MLNLLKKLTKENKSAARAASCTPIYTDFVFSDIPENIANITTKLNQAGFEAYLVGGCVRDKLLQHKPKDFDIATSASPEEVKQVFGRRATIIGKRFRIVHIHTGNQLVEVTTFRGAEVGARNLSASGQILIDNNYGTLQEDAFRRDLTVNALYYDVRHSQIIDYTGGYADAQQRRLRIIGDPLQRCIEDPARMIRCVRFAAKLEFALPPVLCTLFQHNAALLERVSPLRMLNEFVKLSLSGSAVQAMSICRQTGLLDVLFPGTSALLQGKDDLAHQANLLLNQALANTDERVRNKGRVSQFYLIGVLLWPLVRSYIEGKKVNQYKIHHAGISALQDIHCMKIPKSFTLRIINVWVLQLRMQYPHPRIVPLTLGHKDFGAACDFLQLREHSGELADTRVSEWWREVQDLDEQDIPTAIGNLPKLRGKKQHGYSMRTSLFHWQPESE